MQVTSSILFAVMALLLLIYTFFGVDPNHYFLINAAWNSNLIEAKMVCYLIAGLGFCLSAFYAIFSCVLYSKRLIALHLLLFFLLAIVLVLWDNNIFSLHDAIDSQDFSTLGEMKSEYKNVLDKDHAYRVLFWVLLCLQTIGLLNLLLGFFKTNKD